MDLSRVADILLEKIKKDYKDDIALVVIMGSYASKDTYHKSDLDLYFVPKTERGRNLGMVFIIDGIGFDFWPISWERLEQIANHNAKITSIITEGKILYYGSDNDLERFNRLKAKALDGSDKHKFIRKAQEKLNEAYRHYFKLLDAVDLSEVRMQAMEIIFSLTWAIALLNRTIIKRGRGKLKDEIMAMPLLPQDFPLLYDTVFVSSDMAEINNAYRQLLKNTEELIRKEQTREREAVSFRDKLNGYYEELINFYNKIYYACETGDLYSALIAAVELTLELKEAFAGTGVSLEQLPGIVGAFDPNNMGRFLELVHEHEKQLVELLKSNGVKIRVFRDPDELKEYMASL